MRKTEAGFTLVELMIAVGVLAIVSSTVFSGVLNLSKVNAMIANRSEMHSGVRNATELLQQEVGQAGRIALPKPATLGTSVAATGAATVTVNVVGGTSVDGMFVGEQLVIDTGDNEETVTLTGVNKDTKQITATFVNAHAAGVPITVYGGFAAGIIPTTTANGSTGTVLKLFGDINGNGQMVYVEYTCDTGTGNLYRRSIAYDATVKPPISASQSLLNNIVANPDATPCFTYQQQTVSSKTFVVDVAITLTVQTAEKDPITGLYQKETKALLNVSPRNVFNVWQLAGLGIGSRVQSTPASVTALLPGT